jgi:hypothetical protein
MEKRGTRLAARDAAWSEDAHERVVPLVVGSSNSNVTWGIAGLGLMQHPLVEADLARPRICHSFRAGD